MKYAFFAVILVSFLACAPVEEQIERPNILWISHEDLSPVYGCYGDKYANTPNIDKLAQSGIVFTNAFSNAPICAPARSTLITGMYATSLGTQHLRSEIPVPENLKILSEVLRDAGYYTSNNAKTDYNFDFTGRWDDCSNSAHWRKRPEGKPFFSVFNFGITHEGSINGLSPEAIAALKNHHDPQKAKLPPFLPDSQKMREIWAYMYDLLSVFDNNVGELIAQLKEDGELDNTIIFVFSDHGNGLPGYKRWLNNAGLQVPLVLYVPEKYKNLVDNINGSESDKKVGFVDFAPTVIKLAGAEIPEMMEGRNFLGNEAKSEKYIYGYRDRADDCYDMSRSVYNGRYIYIRHFMPKMPYFQHAIIFNKEGSYKEIHRLEKLGQLPEGTQEMLLRKPVEQLFDLKNDPFEQNNLINENDLKDVVANLRENLNNWMLKHHDTGLFNEGEMMQRAKVSQISVFEMARNYKEQNFARILEAAQKVGKTEKVGELVPYLKDDDSAVRYWGLVALDAYEGDISEIGELLTCLLDDKSESVAIKAAEIKVKRLNDKAALSTLEKMLKLDFEPMVLQAAISTRLIEDKAAPLIPEIQNEIMPRYSGNVWGRYKNWLYPMFIGMALDQTLMNCKWEDNSSNLGQY